jgi:hypothetical protein
VNLLPIVRFVALVATGLLAGIFLGDRMGLGFARPALPSFFLCAAAADSYFEGSDIVSALLAGIFAGISAIELGGFRRPTFAQGYSGQRESNPHGQLGRLELYH